MRVGGSAIRPIIRELIPIQRRVRLRRLRKPRAALRRRRRLEHKEGKSEHVRTGRVVALRAVSSPGVDGARCEGARGTRTAPLHSMWPEEAASLCGDRTSGQQTRLRTDCSEGL